MRIDLVEEHLVLQVCLSFLICDCLIHQLLHIGAHLIDSASDVSKFCVPFNEGICLEIASRDGKDSLTQTQDRPGNFSVQI